jgi:hypothetical protein
VKGALVWMGKDGRAAVLYSAAQQHLDALFLEPLRQQHMAPRQAR